MSALTMILTAAMMVPGDGSEEKVSGEMTEPQRLCLNLEGRWKATFYRNGQVLKGEAGVNGGRLLVHVPLGRPGAKMVYVLGEFVDEGKGNLRMGGRLGIYKQDDDHLRVCLGNHFVRPTAYQANQRQVLIELSRDRFTK